MSVEDGYVNVTFVRPTGPALKFFLPRRPDICCIPIGAFYKEVEAPSTVSTARYYSFDEKVMT